MSQGLLITAIGMGLVFVMILALWGIMALLTALTGKAAESEAAQAAEEAAEEVAVAPVYDSELSDEDAAAHAVGAAAAAMAAAQDGQKAAAIAVAYAMAKFEGGNLRGYLSAPRHNETQTSQWLSAGRAQQTFRTGR